MKKTLVVIKTLVVFILVLILLFSFASCQANTVIVSDPPSYTEYQHKPPERVDMKSDGDTIAIKDGTNYIVLTMADGKVASAEYAFQFGTKEAANNMYEFYKKNGYDPQYSSGRVDGTYLIMSYSDTSKFAGMTESDIYNVFGDKIADGYFSEEASSSLYN